ncbi:helix-turn-helix domain-containing protein, partial [Streptomyces sp. TRM64462]|uniref:helix-turn-helix domain-containing protein n=1 Tax=Streptomyces sp. TRM64462 TaxID=2741726 RepID=UPI0020C807B2
AADPVPGSSPRFGVLHVNTRHTSRFTVVGNHLAQHRQLSLLAMGLALHIQSLPDGARIGIRFLAARFPESEQRIAAALRELEAAGYLERRRERLDNGKVVTRTVFYNQPKGQVTSPPPPPPPPKPPAQPPNPAPAPVPKPAPKPKAALPAPRDPEPGRLQAATALLAGLRRDHPRLLLAEPDVQRLAPAVAAWLERDARPDAVRQALTAGLPEQIAHPAAFLGHRLAALIPPPLPDEPAADRPAPLQTCEDCDRAFRAPAPGRCRDCR